ISGGYGSQHNAKGLSIDMSTSLNSTGTVYGLHVAKSGVSSTSVGGYFSATGGTEGNYGLIVSSGLVGIGTTTPTANLTASGTIRFTSLGSAGGNLVTDTDGNVTVSSDERLKDIQSDYERGLVDIMKIVPINYKWKPETGYETSNVYTGFSAQNLSIAIPEAVATSSSGYLTIADRPILAALVNAVKDIGSFINKIENGIAYLKNVVVDRFTVGSNISPEGITMYDEDTGLPYCMKIKSGVIVNQPGECSSNILNNTSSVESEEIIMGDFVVEDNTILEGESTTTDEVLVETGESVSTTSDEIINDGIEEASTTTDPIITNEEEIISTSTEETIIDEPIIEEQTEEVILDSSEQSTTTPIE
ncbi:MAG: tail fiber domain-containing protein, partial [Candidatus Paceibacterota bacterium]